MRVDNAVKDAASKIRAAVSVDLTDQEVEAVRAILSKMAVEVVSKTSEHCCDSASKLCGPRTDMAHQIAEGITREKIALIANLQSMR